jgi:hypothetical protein
MFYWEKVLPGFLIVRMKGLLKKFEQELFTIEFIR